MSTHKHIDTICIVIVLFTLLLTVLFMNGKALGIAVVASEENSDEIFTENDQNAAWDTSNATKITLSDSGSTVSGNGAYASDGNIHIVYAGKYVVSGELSNGKIIIEADGDDKIWLMLCGASIHCNDDAALRVEQAGKVFLTLKDGTENMLSSDSEYSSDAISAGVDGTIYSRDDLTINGTGSLSITAEYQHGIVCNDDLVITGGYIAVTSAQDGFHVNDSVRIKEADITISAGDDGITVSNDDETAYLYMESGNVSIPSCYEGLEAIRIAIAGGTLDISPSDDGINANGYSDNSAIYITGGEITITNENGRDADGLDSNNDIFISGGKVFVSVSDSGGSCAIDCGSENGGVCVINGGTVIACGSSGMAEGFDSSSTQGFLMYTTSADDETTVTVKNADGNVLLSETVPFRFSSVLVSTPDMKIGDTCTITVGDTETEMTIDNSSNSGGFGSGRMPGGKGFGRKGNDEMFGGRRHNQMPNSVTAQDNAEETNVVLTTNFLSTTGNEMQNGNAMVPEMPSGANGDGIKSDTPQGNREFRGRFSDGNMQQPNDGNDVNIQNQGNSSQTVNNGATISLETILLLGISLFILLIGCIVAFFYKQRT